VKTFTGGKTMPWCPKCKTEYENGYNLCSDCGSELVKELPEEAPVEYDKQILLTTVNNDMQASLLESLLTAYKIPVYKRYKEAGAYMEVYMGMARFGVDIFVPSKLKQQALEILNSQAESLAEDTDFQADENNMEQLEEEYQKKRQLRTWLLLLIFLVPLGIGAIAGLIYLLLNI
jgi:predicted amidophosphoribosyltransferase